MLLACHAQAQGQAYECGSDISQYFVPNSPLGFRFLDACMGHDHCYERCEGAGADLKGPGGRCEQAPTIKEARRGICDSRFHDALIKECLKEYFRRTCELLAKVYTVAVRFGGKGSFNGLEIRNLVRVLQAEPSYDISALNQALDDMIRSRKNISGQKVVLGIYTGGAKIRVVDAGAFAMEQLRAGKFEGIQIDPEKLAPAEMRLRIEDFRKNAPKVNPGASAVGSQK